MSKEFSYKVIKHSDGNHRSVVVTMNGNLVGEGLENGLMGDVASFIADGYTNVVVDLSKLKFVTSSGIGILITMLTKIRNKGGEMILVNPSEKLNKLLAMTKLLAIFRIVDSVDNANLIFNEN